MVEDRITDGRRIAQLLASELDGRSDGPLDRIAVANADPDVEPRPEGAHAYDVVCAGDTVASVSVLPESVRIVVSTNADAAVETVDVQGLRTEPEPGDGGRTIVIEHGAAVKRAVDALTAAVDPPG